MNTRKNDFRRTQVQFTDKQHRALLAEAEEKGISLSELLRRIVDKHLEGKN